MTLLYDPQAWLSFLTLLVLEIVLGIDNIIFLVVLVDRLPPRRRRSARFLGLTFAMLTRIALLYSVTWIQGPTDATSTVYITGADGEEQLAGHAGELHPRVVQAFRLPDRTCAVELDLSVIEAAAAALPPAQAPTISAYPVATQDVALVVRDTVPAAEVQAALTAGAAAAAGDGPKLLEDARLFDIYTGEQVGEGNKSLAYRLRFRAPDRTLTDEETSAARDAAVAEAARRAGAVLRDGS